MSEVTDYWKPELEKSQQLNRQLSTELALLREFYQAVTAPNCVPMAIHDYGCPQTINGKKHGACDCGGEAKKSRIIAALQSLATKDSA